MSFDGVFYIKKWCAEEKRFFQFSKFLDQAILKVFIRVESFFFFMVVHTMSAIFCFPYILFIADWTYKWAENVHAVAVEPFVKFK